MVKPTEFQDPKSGLRLQEYAYEFRKTVNNAWVESQEELTRLASRLAPPGYEQFADTVARWTCFAIQDGYLDTQDALEHWINFAWGCIRVQVQNNKDISATLFAWSRGGIPPAMSRCRWFINRDGGYWKKWIAGEYTKEGE